MIKLQKVLFPTDFSELSMHGFAYARSFAEAFQAELHVVHVIDEAYQYWMMMGPSTLPVGPPPDDLLPIATKELEKFAAANLADGKIRFKTKALMGRPFMEIISYAKEQEIDLIVIGTHGRGGLRHVLMGSVAEKVVRKAPCPVLTIRNPEHEFVMP